MLAVPGYPAAWVRGDYRWLSTVHQQVTGAAGRRRVIMEEMISADSQ